MNHDGGARRRHRLLPVELPPDVFAIVMATGIVSIAAAGHDYRRIAILLGLIAPAIFCLLVIDLLMWFTIGPRRSSSQVHDPDGVLRMFAFVAACAVLAVRWNMHREIAWFLALLGVAAWLVLVPLAVIGVYSRGRKDLLEQAHGGWLLASVATEGLAITAADLSFQSGNAALAVLAAIALMFGVVVYVLIAGLIVWRAMTLPRIRDAAAPDIWILMGGLAITSLAADHLLVATGSDSLDWLKPCLRPLTLAAWISASAWIPPLLYAEVWRVDIRAGAPQYQDVWWAAVFPLGMYSAATQATSAQLGMRSLNTISLVFFWVAATVWLVVVVGLVHFMTTAAQRR